MVVAAGNVANLLLARAIGRRQELAIRAALGAGRGRLVRQMVTESLMLAALGGGVGVALGAWGARILAAMRLPGDLPVRFDFQLDGRVLAYTAAVMMITGLLVGVLPAMRASGADLDRTLRQSRHSSPGTEGHRLRGLPRGGPNRPLLRASCRSRVVRAEPVQSQACRSRLSARRGTQRSYGCRAARVHRGTGASLFRGRQPPRAVHPRRPVPELRVHGSHGLHPM